MTINPNLRLQPTDEQSLDGEGGASLTIEWKGLYTDCKTMADTITIGDDLPTSNTEDGHTPKESLYVGYHVESYTIRRGFGDTAILSVACRLNDSTSSTDGGGSTNQPFRIVYSVKSVRNDVSILAYCGTSASNPNRAAIERWMREPNPKLATEFKYTDENGSEVDMNDDPLLKASVPLVRKIMSGTERVIRFYPQLTIRRQYYLPPPNDFENLSHIDTPPSPGGDKTLSPSGIASLISAYEWLKVQDDCDEQQDRSWMRTESWIGILKSDSNENKPWDRNLYGEEGDRWKMPASPL